jgi:hypothetical protein
MAIFFRAIQIARKYNNGEPITKKRGGKQKQTLAKEECYITAV